MRWSIKPKHDPETVNAFARELGIDAVLSQLLLQRGIDTFDKARNFFRPSMDQLHDPFLMQDMNLAVERILTAMELGESIMVYGDYDVDGTTSVTLMSTFLTDSLGYDRVMTYIPDRYTEGYGVSYTGIDVAGEKDVSLIIALDCGVKAVEKVDYAKRKGIDFIICDHHRPGKKLPDAIAVLDPKRTDCNYPYDELCGCGVGFKLAQALCQAQQIEREHLTPYLDLVATAIGADIVPITGENRVLCYFGMQVINSNPRPGFQAFIDGMDKKKILSVRDVVFTIAPRINAAGRMEHALGAVKLLTAKDLDEARVIAGDIENNNNDRKESDRSATQEALQQIEDLGEQDRSTTVVFHKKWHKGVIGIVASRLIETYYRPTLVFTRSNGDRLAASARSVKGFDVYNALEQCSEFIEQFGGHKYAAGLTLKIDQYDAFKARFEEVVTATIHEKDKEEELIADSELNLRQIDARFYRVLKQLAPFGPGNMRPMFLSQQVYDAGYTKCVGQDDAHLKLNVKQKDSQPINGIAFSRGSDCELLKSKKPVDLMYILDENHWNGNVSIELMVRDIRPS